MSTYTWIANGGDSYMQTAHPTRMPSMLIRCKCLRWMAFACAHEKRKCEYVRCSEPMLRAMSTAHEDDRVATQALLG